MRIPSLILVLFFAGCLADLRPDGTRLESSSAPDARSLLAKMSEAHGGHATWLSKRAVSVEMRDVWPPSFLGLAARPWTEGNQAFDLVFVPGTNNGSMTFKNGTDQGLRWGIQNWSTFVDSEFGVEFDDNDDAKFWLPTTIYFVEVPFLISTAEIARLLERETVNGISYHRVFVTWGEQGPQSNVDQYVAWINPESFRLEYLQYTVRDFGPNIVGAMKFSDFEKFDQFTIAKTMQVVTKPGGDPTLHRFEIEDVSFPEDLPETFFIPNPRLGSRKY